MKYREIEKYVLELVKKHSSINDAVRDFLTFIASPDVEDAVQSLMKFDYKKDYDRITNSIRDILYNAPPKIRIKAYWFGIYEAIQNGSESFQAYISATDVFDSGEESEDWNVDPKYFPPARFFESTVLEKSHPLSIEYDGYFEIKYFVLWYLTLVIGIFAKTNHELFLINTKKCFVCVGFDEGDYNTIGCLNSNGLNISSIKLPQPAKLKKTKTKFEFYSMKCVFRGAWVLDCIRQKDGSGLVSGFSSICKRMDNGIELKTAIIEKNDGVSVDYSEVPLSGPVVSQRVMEAIQRHCGGEDVQFITLSIENHQDESFYVMNVLKSFDGLDMKATVFILPRFAKKIVLQKTKLGGCGIFRLSDDIINNLVFVNSRIKEELERLEITGIELTGIETTSPRK
jgi:hypothetical protein